MSLDIEAIEAREKAASPGPWQADRDGAAIYLDGPPYDWGTRPGGVMENCHDPDCGCVEEVRQALADGDFIAHARSDIPALIEEVKRLQGVVKNLGAQLIAANVLAETKGEIASAMKADPAAQDRLHTLMREYDEMKRMK